MKTVKDYKHYSTSDKLQLLTEFISFKRSAEAFSRKHKLNKSRIYSWVQVHIRDGLTPMKLRNLPKEEKDQIMEHLKSKLKSVTSGATTLTFNIPTGYAIDTTKMPVGSFAKIGTVIPSSTNSAAELVHKLNMHNLEFPLPGDDLNAICVKLINALNHFQSIADDKSEQLEKAEQKIHELEDKLTQPTFGNGKILWEGV